MNSHRVSCESLDVFNSFCLLHTWMEVLEYTPEPARSYQQPPVLTCLEVHV